MNTTINCNQIQRICSKLQIELLKVIPSKTLWSSWAQKPSCVPQFSDSSFSFHDLPRVPTGRFKQLLMRERREWETKDPKSLYHFTFSLSINKNSRCCTHSLAFSALSVLDCGHSDRCAVVSCCFNLQFSDNIRCRAFIHMLISVYLL